MPSPLAFPDRIGVKPVKLKVTYIHCPKCSYRSSGFNEGQAINAITAHLVYAHSGIRAGGDTGESDGTGTAA